MAMYKDAKDWLEQNATEGGISLDQLVSFILCEVSNDDVERWFGVNMEDDSDNPGAGTAECPVCGIEKDEADHIAEHGMCESCLEDEQESEEEADEDDSEVFYNFEIGTRRLVWLNSGDFDYVQDPANDANVYPFSSSETL